MSLAVKFAAPFADISCHEFPFDYAGKADDSGQRGPLSIGWKNICTHCLN